MSIWPFRARAVTGFCEKENVKGQQSLGDKTATKGQTLTGEMRDIKEALMNGRPPRSSIN